MELAFSNYYISESFPELHELKDQLLELIDNAHSTVQTEAEGSTNPSIISKLDWEYSKDMERPWVQLIYQHLGNKLADMVRERYHCRSIRFTDLWFQQYKQNDSHGWHIHNSNWSGVYYLELPQDENNLTQLYLDNKVVTPEVKEGEICIFPSTAIHRGMRVESIHRKTIISYNFEMVGITREQLNILYNL